MKRNNESGFGVFALIAVITLVGIFSTGSQIIIGDNNKTGMSNTRVIGEAGNISSVIGWLKGDDAVRE